MSGGAGTGILADPSGLGTPNGDDLELGVSPGDELVGEPAKDWDEGSTPRSEGSLCKGIIMNS